MGKYYRILQPFFEKNEIIFIFFFKFWDKYIILYKKYLKNFKFIDQIIT